MSNDKVRFIRHLHRNKEDNYDLKKFFGDPDLVYCGYEEELVYEYDKKTKKLRLIGANGFFLGDEVITGGEITEIVDP